MVSIALRVGGGLITLPLALRVLAPSELGLYYTFLSLTGLAMLLDFGFAQTIGRNAAFAMAVQHQLSLEIARPFHVFGEGEHPSRFWPSLVAAAKEGLDFPMTEGSQIRDFIHVSEVAASLLDSCLFVSRSHAVIRLRNIGGGSPESLLSFAEKWWKKYEARGTLLNGAIPSRQNEVARYVACLTPACYKYS
jgi:nucleoside-diphosphate-sugar epimerase